MSARTGAPPTPETVDRSLRASVRDGMWHAVTLGTGESYFGAFGIHLRATTLQIGLLATIPPLVGALCQWAGAVGMDRLRSRRAALVTGAAIQGIACVPIALLPFLLGPGPGTAWVLIGLASVYFAAYGAIAPIWNSLIGDLVPPDIRGRYFGRRNRFTGASTFGALVGTGLLLDLFERTGRVAFGFLVAFLVAAAARVNSARWLRRYEDPPFEILPDQKFSFGQFIRRAPFSNFAKFVFFFAAINFGVAVSGPYFALYMLRDLEFSYLQFTGVIAAANFTQILTFTSWGALSDRFGNKKILNVCGWGLGVVPILWLASSSIPYLIAIQVFSGFVWAGFNLASANFMFDAVTPPKRARCAAYQAVVHGVFVCLGSLAGAFLAGRLPQTLRIGGWSWTPVSELLLIFLASGLLRFVAAGVFLNRFREVRPVETISEGQLIYQISHLRPVAGASFSVLTDLFHRHEPFHLPRPKGRRGEGDGPRGHDRTDDGEGQRNGGGGGRRRGEPGGPRGREGGRRPGGGKSRPGVDTPGSEGSGRL